LNRRSSSRAIGGFHVTFKGADKFVQHSRIPK
jgi:hypothetical protein